MRKIGYSIVALLSLAGCSDHNELIDMPQRTFYEIASPLMKGAHARDCQAMWGRGDPGSSDCGPLARKLAAALGAGVSADDLREPMLWERYSQERLRASTRALNAEADRLRAERKKGK